MDFVFDLLQGAGIAAAIGIRPFLPVLLVGALAAGDIGIDFDGTDFAFLEQAPLLAIVVRAARASRSTSPAAPGPSALERPPWAYLFGTFAVVMGILFAAGAMAEDDESIVPGIIVGTLCAGLGLVVARDLLSRTRKRLDADAASALPLYAEGAGLARRRRLGALPAARRPRDRRAARPAARRPPPRRREVRRPAHPAMSAGGAKPKKLVLTVIDAMKPAMLERAVTTGPRAGAEAADRARRDGRRLRRGVPLGDAGVRGEHRHRRRARRSTTSRR